MISVLDNAYLRKAEEISSYNEVHKKILLFLLYEKKYYTKDELVCFTNNCEPKLNKILKELETSGLVKTEGWLVKLQERERLEKQIISEIRPIKEKPNQKVFME